MTFKQDFQTLVDTMPSLALAVARLVEQQEKRWGCFQIKKGEDKIYRLHIPSLPILKLKVSGNHSYRAFWGNNNRSSVYTKQNKKTLNLTPSELTKMQKDWGRSKSDIDESYINNGRVNSLANNNKKKQVIVSSSKKTIANNNTKPKLVTMNQNIYEIVYYHSATSETNVVNQMIAGFIQEKIENITSETLIAANELKPLILTTVKN